MYVPIIKAHWARGENTYVDVDRWINEEKYLNVESVSTEQCRYTSRTMVVNNKR